MNIDEELSAEDQQHIYDGLVAFGDQFAPPRNYRPLQLVLRDENGRVLAGFIGSVVWGWLQVDAIWVEESHRAKGIGSRLLAEAEQRSRRLGCTRARLDTFDFEARSFYEKHGYVVYAQLEEFPRGHQQFHLQKVLDEVTTTA